MDTPESESPPDCLDCKRNVTGLCGVHCPPPYEIDAPEDDIADELQAQIEQLEESLESALAGHNHEADNSSLLEREASALRAQIAAIKEWVVGLKTDCDLRSQDYSKPQEYADLRVKQQCAKRILAEIDRITGVAK